MNQPYGYIYLIYDHFHNHCYIGQKKGLVEKTTDYFGSGKIIFSIIKKRKHHLEKRILGYCETKEELDEAEKVCVEFYQSNDRRYGYNITTGGSGGSFKGINKGRNFSNEHKSKLSQKRRLRIISGATKHKISESLKGKQNNLWTEESRKRNSNSHLGNQNKLGCKLSPESRQRISQSQLGKKRGPYKKSLDQKI